MKYVTTVLMMVAMTFATDTRVVREAKTLINHGFRVEVLCWDRQGQRPSNEILHRCIVRNVRFGKTSLLPYPKLYYVIAALLFQATIVMWALNRSRKRRNVILHSHDFNTLLGCVIAKKLLKGRVKLVYDSHELTPGVYYEWYGPLVSAIVARLEFAAVRRVDAFIASNDAILSHLQRAASVPASVIHNCPAISDVPKDRPSEAKKKLGLDRLFVVLFTGKVRQDYDFDLILNAALDFKARKLQDFRFVLIGLPEPMKVLADTVASRGLQNLFDFRGWVSHEDWLLYYTASDLCFAVTRDLGPNTKILTPNKLFESMACGVPVIVRDGTLAADLVRRWNFGIVVQSDDVALSKDLVRLSENRETLRSMGDAGRRAFLSEYNWDRMEKRLLEIYWQLAVPLSARTKFSNT